MHTQYENQGIIRIERFLEPAMLALIRDEILRAEKLALEDLGTRWGGEKVTFFTMGKREDFVTTPYFQASADAVHIFFEEIGERLVLNRLGHGLHLKPELPALADLVYANPRLHSVLREIGYKKPACLLSVYIPKHPDGFGSEVRPHQESTFAHTEPQSACVLWVALEDADIENACMYGLPGSHRLPLKFVSRVDHAGRRRDYVQINEADIPEFDPARPAPYVPLEVKAGDALLFHGNFVHCSPQNRSTRSRKALSLQFIETDGATLSDFNWIRKPSARSLYE